MDLQGLNLHTHMKTVKKYLYTEGVKEDTTPVSLLSSIPKILDTRKRCWNSLFNENKEFKFLTWDPVYRRFLPRPKLELVRSRPAVRGLVASHDDGGQPRVRVDEVREVSQSSVCWSAGGGRPPSGFGVGFGFGVHGVTFRNIRILRVLCLLESKLRLL